MDEYFFTIKAEGLLTFSIDAESKEEAIKLARQCLGDNTDLQVDGRVEFYSFSASKIYGSLLEYPPNSDNWIEVEELVKGVRLGHFRRIYLKAYIRGFLKSTLLWIALGILLSRLLDHLIN